MIVRSGQWGLLIKIFLETPKREQPGKRFTTVSELEKEACFPEADGPHFFRSEA